ncbi:MAG: lytic transglycosylase domain-containing protein [Acidobacteria bacterium]|nr:lytic transglycosylase domain-containing protein [Acidobacteriota bacterium]
MPQDQYDLNSFRREMQKTPAQPLIDRIADEEGLSPSARRTLRGMSQQEGGKLGTQTSGANAHGPLQVVPETGLRYVSPAEWETLEGKVRAGVRYTKHLDELFGGDSYYTAAAYHAGEGKVLPYFKSKERLPRSAEFYDKAADIYTGDHAQRVLSHIGQGDDDPLSFDAFRAEGANQLTKPAQAAPLLRRESRRGPVRQNQPVVAGLERLFDYQQSTPLFGQTPDTPVSQPSTPPTKQTVNARTPRLTLKDWQAAPQQARDFLVHGMALPDPEEQAPKHWDKVAAQNRQAQEAKQKKAQERGGQWGALRRLGEGVKTGVGQTALGLADLPRTMLKSRLTPEGQASVDEAYGSVGKTFDEWKAGLQEDEAAVSALPPDASWLQQAARLGGNAAGQVLPMVALTAMGVPPVAAAITSTVGQDVARETPGDEMLLDALWAGVGAKAGGMAERLALGTAAKVAPGSALGRQLTGRAITGAAGAGVGGAEALARGMDGQDALQNIVTSGLMDAAFYPGRQHAGASGRVATESSAPELDAQVRQAFGLTVDEHQQALAELHTQAQPLLAAVEQGRLAQERDAQFLSQGIVPVGREAVAAGQTAATQLAALESQAERLLSQAEAAAQYEATLRAQAGFWMPEETSPEVETAMRMTDEPVTRATTAATADPLSLESFRAESATVAPQTAAAATVAELPTAEAPPVDVWREGQLARLNALFPDTDSALGQQTEIGAEGVRPNALLMETPPDSPSAQPTNPPALHRRSGEAGFVSGQVITDIGQGIANAASAATQPGARGRFFDTVGSAQTAAQLATPKFVGRNIVQHFVFTGQEKLVQGVASALDAGFSKLTGTARTNIAPDVPFFRHYVDGMKQAVAAHQQGQPLPGKPNLPPGTRSNKLGKAFDNLLFWINEVPDAGNWTGHYQRAFDALVKTAQRSGQPLNGKARAALLDRAMAEANYATLRDPNFVSETASRIRSALNSLSKPVTGTENFGLGDFVLKYSQTPGALTKRALEYSPLGLFEAARHAVHAVHGADPYARRQALLSLSRATVGTAQTLGAGAALNALGILAAPSDEKDYTLKAEEGRAGLRGFSVNLSALVRLPETLNALSRGVQPDLRPVKGDKLVPIDWVQPWAMGASVGASLMELQRKGELTGMKGAQAGAAAAGNSLTNVLEVMGDQSVFKNVAHYLEQARGRNFVEATGNIARSIAVDAPASFVPGLLRQTRGFTDDYTRDTRPETRRGLSGVVEEARNKVLTQLPGVSSRFPARVSLLTGEPVKTAIGQQGAPGKLAATVLPGQVNTYDPSAIQTEISRLNRALPVGEGVSLRLPRLSGKAVGVQDWNEPTSLLREREAAFGHTFAAAAGELVNSLEYETASDAEKALALKKLIKELRTATYRAEPRGLAGLKLQYQFPELREEP